MLRETCTGAHVVGMDMFREGLLHARRRAGCPLVQGDVRVSPFATSFDLIALFDVLEHLPQDESVLECIRGMLRPGGRLLVTVPAYPSLWSYFDEAALHQRRYTPVELRSKLRTAGFEIEYLSPFMSLLFPVMWLGRRLRGALRGGRPEDTAARRRLSEGELRIVPGINSLLAWLMRPEAAWVSRRRRLPFGTSLIALATARGQPE